MGFAAQYLFYRKYGRLPYIPNHNVRTCNCGGSMAPLKSVPPMWKGRRCGKKEKEK